MANSFGKMFTITSFGESHGRCVGIVIDGCPAGLPLEESDIQKEVDRRKPSGPLSTPRAEEEKAKILSGVYNGRTTGAPLTLLIWNSDARSGDYDKLKDTPRPGHADYTAALKYGRYNDPRGGGRFSGRITASFVMAGAVARKLLALKGMEILAHTVQVGDIRAGEVLTEDIQENVEKNLLRCADPAAAEMMQAAVEEAMKEGDSLGGIIEGIVVDVPAGLGEPVFDTLEGELSKALFAIPAVKGVEFGAGFTAAGLRGSENNDSFTVYGDTIETDTNNAGGILGGISSGMPLILRVAVKPTPSIAKAQSTVNTKTMQNEELEIGGRHDACIVPRAVPVVEAMIAVTLCDFARRAGILPEVIE